MNFVHLLELVSDIVQKCSIIMWINGFRPKVEKSHFYTFTDISKIHYTLNLYFFQELKCYFLDSDYLMKVYKEFTNSI